MREIRDDMSTSTWHELASSPRWRGVVAFIRHWVGPFDSNAGMSPVELDMILRAKHIHVPAAVREWNVLAANWKRDGVMVWTPPESLAVEDGELQVLSDTEGINSWRVRVTDFQIDDPPVVSIHDEPGQLAFPRFSQFVAAMIINEVIYGTSMEAAELDPVAARVNLVCLVSSSSGDFYTDASLEIATVVAFCYPKGSAAHGKARNAAGRELLNRLLVGRVQ